MTHDRSDDRLANDSDAHLWDVMNPGGIPKKDGIALRDNSRARHLSKSVISTKTTRAMLLLCLLSASAATLCVAQVRAAQDNRANAPPFRPAYMEKISKTYSFPFGKGNIALPGNASFESGGFLDPSIFPNAAYCGHCHQQAFREWRQSLHSNSFRTPFYTKSVDILVQTKGVEYARYCDSCHNPIAVLSGAIDPKSTVDRSFDSDGLTCTTCHSIQSVEPKLGNGSYVMGVPAVMVDEKGNRIPGVQPDAEILAHLDRHFKAVMQDFYRQPEFCSACHKASLPPELNGYKWLRSFTPYDEWQDSMFSHENPLTFYQAGYASCQDCHMKRERTSQQYSGAKGGGFPSHRWLAGNTAVPFNYGYEEQLDKTIAFLKSSNYIGIDLFCLKAAGNAQMPAPIGSAPVNLSPGEVVQAYVVIQNKGIGHSFIPELRDLYEAWVRFSVKDAGGNTIYESGSLEPDGTLEPRAHAFVNRPIDAAGNSIDKHIVWNEHAEGYDNTIQSGHSQLVRYQFRIPMKLRGPITIIAAVEYRHFREDYLDFVLGKDHAAYPVVELAAQSETFHLGMNAPPKPLATDNPKWMRWNNFGIALLDQQRLNDAAQAFRQVIRLRPEYKDGYINLALAYIQSGNFAEARIQLERALAIKQSDSRALYYMALVERHEAHPAAEITDLEQVEAQYPLCREARRDLGIAYEDQHRTIEALEQFEALLDIDPDDLEAHHQLAGIYRRIGMITEANAEDGQYNKEREDPAAPSYSQNFLRAHPEILTESVLWHVHSYTDSAGQSNTPNTR